MNNPTQLRQRLKDNPHEVEKICKQTTLSKNCFRRKLYNPKKFTIFEIITIKRILGLNMDETINFFAPTVANRNY